MKKLLILLLIPFTVACGLTKETTKKESSKNTVVNTTIDRNILKDTVTEIEIPASLFREYLGIKSSVREVQTEKVGVDTTQRIESDRINPRKDTAVSDETVRITITDKSEIKTEAETNKKIEEKEEVETKTKTDNRALWQRPILLLIGLGAFTLIVGYGALRYFRLI